jgi:hypothetical protein
MGLHPLLDGRIVVPEALLQLLASVVRLLTYGGALEEGAQGLSGGQSGCLADLFGGRFGGRFALCLGGLGLHLLYDRNWL